MPIYEYRCPNGHVFELFQRFHDPQPEACETCGAGPVRRVLYPVAVHYKGSGFYSTDYGRGRRKGKEAGEGSGSTSTDGATPEKSGEKTGEKSGEKKAAEA